MSMWLPISLQMFFVERLRQQSSFRMTLISHCRSKSLGHWCQSGRSILVRSHWPALSAACRMRGLPGTGGASSRLASTTTTSCRTRSVGGQNQWTGERAIIR
jgi:hypothetical protein